MTIMQVPECYILKNETFLYQINTQDCYKDHTDIIIFLHEKTLNSDNNFQKKTNCF